MTAASATKKTLMRTRVSYHVPQGIDQYSGLSRWLMISALQTTAPQNGFILPKSDFSDPLGRVFRRIDFFRDDWPGAALLFEVTSIVANDVPVDAPFDTS